MKCCLNKGQCFLTHQNPYKQKEKLTKTPLLSNFLYMVLTTF